LTIEDRQSTAVELAIVRRQRQLIPIVLCYALQSPKIHARY